MCVRALTTHSSDALRAPLNSGVSRSSMDKLPEFAEQSSTRERVRHVVIGIFVEVPVVAIYQLRLFPSVREFSESAACRSVFGIPLTKVCG